MKDDGNDLSAAQMLAETRELDARQLLSFVLERFGDKVAFASSFGAEDQVLTDMLCTMCDAPRCSPSTRADCPRRPMR